MRNQQPAFNLLPTPAAKPAGPSRQLLAIILLTIFVPPLGLVCLWRGARCPVRGKALISILGVLSMTMILVLVLRLTAPAPEETVPALTVPYQYINATAQPTAAPIAPAVPADPVAEPEIVVPDAEATVPPAVEGVVPANPAG